MQGNVLVSDFFGSKYWTLNGLLHREDGPALENANGAKFWYLNGLRHRENGPAVELEDGYRAWYLHNKFIKDVDGDK